MSPSGRSILKPSVLIAVAIVLLSIVLSIIRPVFIEFLEAKTFDLRFLLRGSLNPGDEIVIVGIDDRSLKEVGRWPWSRDRIADLIDAISSGGARTIGVDIIFSEPQATETLKTIRKVIRAYEAMGMDNPAFLKHLRDLEREGDVDARLSQSIERAGNVILPLVLHVPTIYEETPEKRDIPDLVYDYPFMIVREGEYYLPIVASGALLSLEDFVLSAWSVGHVYTQYDRDGAIRWEPLYVELDGMYYPSFGVEIARHWFGYGRDEVVVILGEGVIMGEMYIPTDVSGRVLINYSGRAGTFTTYSAVDVLEGKIPEDAFRDRIVLVGTTALGTTDIHITPFAQIPGIEKQASVVENIIHQNFLRREESTRLVDVMVIVLFGIVMGAGLPGMRALGGGIFAGGLFAGYLAVSQYLFVMHGLWIDVLIPTLTIVLMYSSLTAYRFLTEERRAREIRAMFSSYVTERVVDELLKNPDMARLGGFRREVTVLFSDVRGFTSYSEKRGPEEVVTILNEYLTAMTEIVFKWEGTLDKFVGDEIMAFWGAPLEQKNHAELAVRCALHMVKRLEELRRKWINEGKEPLDMGIGINTGEVLVGNIGAEGKKMDYTIIGDNVNLGARVEGLTRRYNTHILITEFTCERLKELFRDSKGRTRIGHVRLTGLEEVQVKGKERAVRIYELVNLKAEK